MALAFGDTKMAKQFETVPLSHQTVARRVMELNDHVSSKVKDIVQQCKYFSLALDESIDVCDTNQLLIFIRTIDNNFTIHEELLQAVPLQGTAKGSDIYSSLKAVASAYGGFEKCSSVVTDGWTKQWAGWSVKNKWCVLPDIPLYHSSRSVVH